MNDREIFFAAAAIIVAYWWFCLRNKTGVLNGRASTGKGGTVGGGASKKPTTHHNTNAFTNAQQGTGYMPAPIAAVGAGSGAPGSSNVGAPSGRRGVRSASSTGLVGSFVSPSWPTTRVTSTGSKRISSGVTQVPGYAAVPLSVQGPGGGGSWIH